MGRKNGDSQKPWKVTQGYLVAADLENFQKFSQYELVVRYNLRCFSHFMY